jgi:hypothetical protein
MLAQTAVTILPIGWLVKSILIALKDLLAKPDLKSSWFFTRTPLAD